MQITPADPMLDTILGLERRVWHALVTGDAAADAALLSETFLGVYPDGFAGRSDHTGQLAHGPTVQEFNLHDTHLRHLGDDHMLLSYRAEFRRVGRDPPETMYITSIWQRGGTGWINIFSQDTLASG